MAALLLLAYNNIQKHGCIFATIGRLAHNGVNKQTTADIE